MPFVALNQHRGVNGSVPAVYENALAGGSRYGLGGGFTYMGRRLGQARTQAEANAGTVAFDLPAYTTAKLVAYWRLSPALRLSLDVDNLFDTTSRYAAVEPAQSRQDRAPPPSPSYWRMFLSRLGPICPGSASAYPPVRRAAKAAGAERHAGAGHRHRPSR